MSCNMGSNVYVGLVVLTILLKLIVECSSDRTVSYSNEWIVKTQLSEEGLRLLAARKGFKVPRKLVDSTYLLIHTKIPKSSRRRAHLISKNLTADEKIYFVDQLEWKQRSLRAAAPFTVQDAKWNHMWYINRGLFKPTMNVLESWRAGYTGDGVTVAIVDDGVDFHHPDLQPQYEEHLSEDFYDDDTIPLPANGQSHGTMCAGIAVAVKNTVCVIGVAFESRLAVQRVIGPRGANEAGEFRALSKTAGIDIFSNSWGGLDRTTFDGPSPLVARALQQGCSSGRNGKGAIYVFAGGSGGFNDNCNCDGFVNSIYTIAINSVSVDAQPPGYAEPCSAILASTFSGPGGPSDNICTTDVNGGCVEDFQGTSASTPMAAGILALLLQASPELTWRDVQELVVRTSSSRHLKNGRFTTNGVGRYESGNNPFVKVIAVSDWFGYGMLDAQALIQTAQSWQPLPEQHTCSSATGGGTTSIKANVKPRTIEGRLTTEGCNQTAWCVNSLEHVQVSVTFQSTMRGAVVLTLRSPLGTTSNLLTERSADTANSTSHKWTYTSVQSWGEDPTGEWTLTMAIPSYWEHSGSIRSWQLIMYGTGVGCTYKRVHGTVTVTAARQPTGTLTIDESQFIIKCGYTKEAEDLVAVRLKRKRASDSDFTIIVTFPGPTSTQNITYLDTRLKTRSTATRPGNSNSDQATLAYNDVKCSDKAEYQCSVTYLLGSVGDQLSNVLQVNSLKSKSDFRILGQLTFTPASNLKEGDSVMFTCEGDVGDVPPAELAWYMYRDGVTSSTPINLTPGAVTDPPEPVPAECRYNRTSKLNMTLTPDMNNMVIRCTAQQDPPRNQFGDNNDNYHQTNEIPVSYAPNTLEITSVPSIAQGGSYSEGLARLTLTCSSRANPPATYYWTIPDTNTAMEGATLTLENLTVADTNNYTCVAYNEFIGVNHTVQTTLLVSVHTITTRPSTTTTTIPSSSTRDTNSVSTTDGEGDANLVVIITSFVSAVLFIGLIVACIVIVVMCKRRKTKSDAVEVPAARTVTVVENTNVYETLDHTLDQDNLYHELEPEHERRERIGNNVYINQQL